MWADDSDEEAESARPSFGRFFNNFSLYALFRKRPNYTAPVNFVSGGVTVGNKVMEGAEEQKPGPSKNDVRFLILSFDFIFRKYRLRSILKEQSLNQRNGNKWEQMSLQVILQGFI